MTNGGTIEPSEVIARIRERVRARRTGEPEQAMPHVDASPFLAPSAAARYDWRELHANLAACNALHNAVGTINPRRPGLHNDIIQFAKKVMRRSLAWYTRPLHEFHGAVTRTLNETTIALQDVRTAVGIFESRIESYKNVLQSQLEGLERSFRSRSEELERTTSSNGEAIRGLQEAIRGLQRDVRRFADELQHGPVERSSIPQTTSAYTAEQAAELDFDYFMFEERFRGSEAQIKDRQNAYLVYFDGCTDVLDLGCGRGEFLELLREKGVAARGLETGKDALLLCRQKGLEVIEANLLSYLESLRDGSAGGIFCSQVIEHLPPAAQIELVNLAHKKLRANSPLIIETINPECLFALCRNFYLDPTHVRPVHPEMLAFTMRSAGFNSVEIRYSSPVADHQVPALKGAQVVELEAFNRGMKNVNDLLFGNQDYAAIGWR
jgi:2-polyprenyl-3-methyl-5-hydroxy-6-metoxy-1,4-benzoquinol methylase